MLNVCPGLAMPGLTCWQQLCAGLLKSWPHDVCAAGRGREAAKVLHLKELPRRIRSHMWLRPCRALPACMMQSCCASPTHELLPVLCAGPQCNH